MEEYAFGSGELCNHGSVCLFYQRIISETNRLIETTFVHSFITQ
jgi:hypothetical protein